MGWPVADGMNRNIWDYVSPFESYDYVSRWYEGFHGGAAEPAKVREINAAFAQGRMYFENARAASMGVKPLLLYYGVLSLCTGLVLCRDQEKTESTLAHSHGLSRFKYQWEELLAEGAGINNVLSLKIRPAKQGTFREVVNVAWHKHISSIFQGKLGSREIFPYVHDLGQVRFAAGDSCLTLGDLLARSRYTGIGYQDVTGEPSRLHRVTVRFDKGGILFWFPFSVGAVPDDFRKLVGRPGVQIEGAPGKERSFIFQRNDPSIPVFHYEGNYFMCVAEDFPNGDKLSEFLKLYLMSYILGMLARYFPSKWIALLRHDEGGLAQPLLERATKAVETEFIGEFAQQLAEMKDDPQFFGEHFGEDLAIALIPWRRDSNG